MEYFIQQLINGLTLGGMYALIALGYTMVYGVIQLINFAHGEFFTAGGYVGAIVLAYLAGAGYMDAHPVLCLTFAFAVAMAYTAYLAIGVEKAHGEKCERCWIYSTELGTDAEHPTLCPRCTAVIKAMEA